MKKYIKGIAIYFAVLLVVAIFNSICFNGARTVTDNLKAKNKVEIEAVITSANKYTEVDGGFERDYWQVKVSYTYDGRSYNNVFYDNMSSEPELGKKVTVKINPEKPGELLSDDVEYLLSAVLPVIFLAGISVTLYFVVLIFVNSLLKKREQEEESALPKKIALAFVGAKLLVESMVFYYQKDSLVFAAFSIGAIALILIVLFFIKRKKIKKELDI